MNINPSLISACGRICSMCTYFNDNLCKGCKIENPKMEKNACMIYRCVVKKKNILNCLQCSEKRKCKLWRGISMGYCSIAARIELKKLLG